MLLKIVGLIFIFGFGVTVGHFGPKVVFKETVKNAKIVKEKGTEIGTELIDSVSK